MARACQAAVVQEPREVGSDAGVFGIVVTKDLSDSFGHHRIDALLRHSWRALKHRPRYMRRANQSRPRD